MATIRTPGFRPDDPAVYFRRVPGKRRFYIPGTYQKTYSTYFTRQYRATRDVAEQVEQANRSARQAISNRHRRSTFRRGFLLKREHDLGHHLSREERQAATREFRAEYAEMEALRFQINGKRARERKRMVRPGSRLNQILIDMGMRTGEEDFPVGMSPTSQNGYFLDRMVPFLRI